MSQQHRIHSTDVSLTALPEGAMQRVICGDYKIVLCNVNNTVYALDDLCPHEDVALSLGSLCEHRLRCPLHGSEFDIRSGCVLNEPAEADVATYAVSVNQGVIEVTLPEKG